MNYIADENNNNIVEMSQIFYILDIFPESFPEREVTLCCFFVMVAYMMFV